MWSDDPVKDAEYWACREDPRTLIGHCKVCGAPLHSSCEGWDADDGYLIDGDAVCDDCLREYLKDRRIK